MPRIYTHGSFIKQGTQTIATDRFPTGIYFLHRYDGEDASRNNQTLEDFITQAYADYGYTDYVLFGSNPSAYIRFGYYTRINGSDINNHELNAFMFVPIDDRVRKHKEQTKHHSSDIRGDQNHHNTMSRELRAREVELTVISDEIARTSDEARKLVLSRCHEELKDIRNEVALALTTQFPYNAHASIAEAIVEGYGLGLNETRTAEQVDDIAIQLAGLFVAEYNVAQAGQLNVNPSPRQIALDNFIDNIKADADKQTQERTIPKDISNLSDIINIYQTLKE